MKQYKNMFHKEPIPYEITEKSTEYWYKMYCRDGLDDIQSLTGYLTYYNLRDPSKMKWKYLMMKYLEKEFNSYLINNKL